MGGVRLGGLSQTDARPLADRQSASGKRIRRSANKLNLSGQLDYYGKLSSQLEWQQDPGDRPVRVVYSGSGMPTAALVNNRVTTVDYTLFWIPCKDAQEANYLLAIINSDTLYEAVAAFMPKGQFGARHLQKHLWKLPIPEFDPANSLHTAVSKAGEAASVGAAEQLAQLRERTRPRNRHHSPPRTPQMAPQLPRRPSRRIRRDKTTRRVTNMNTMNRNRKNDR